MSFLLRASKSALLGSIEKFQIKRAKQVHTEAYHLDWVWQRIQDYPRRHQVTWYIMTPANYGYIRNFVGADMSKKELDKLLSERVQQMKKEGLKLELHVHFWKFVFMPTPEKRTLLKEAIEWGKKNGIVFKELVPGWWAKDKDLPDLCEELGLRLAKREISTHDYNL